MVSFSRSDLDFILAQILIAEQHAAGADFVSLLPDTEVPFGLRTLDGSFNNLVAGQGNFGTADDIFPRLTDPVFRNAELVSIDLDGPLGPLTVGTPTSYQQTSGFVFDSQPRTISNLIVDQTLNNPAAIAAALRTAGSEDVAADTVSVLAALQAIADAATPAEVTAANAAFTLLAGTLGLQIVTSPGLDGAVGTADDAPVLFIPNVAPDEGLSAGFNAWMTFFGQFFDHGLDLVTKGGSGTIFIPLQPDDPLYVPGGQSNFMVLTRATNQPGADGILGTPDDVHEHTNTTSPFVDQNQTYSSHPSHQVFLRAYEFNSAGEPVATGELITNRNLGDDGQFGTGDDTPIGGMATWAVVKAQARDVLGINLTDANYNNVPLLATDPYGNFIKGPNGFPQVVMRTAGGDGIFGTADDGTELVEGNPDAPISLVNAMRTGHAFLDDIAHSAVPVGDHDGNPATPAQLLTPDADGVAGPVPNPAFDPGAPVGPANQPFLPQPAGTYDNELLDAHFIAGDGRANENIGLTAVHHIFHSEHNRLVEHTKAQILASAASGDVAFLNQWLSTPVAAVPADLSTLEWNGERLFQAAKLGTEMQYQHLVFEEFARTIQPQVDAFIDFDDTINPSIVAEFAHTVYRFGHSMLTETIDRLDPSYTNSEIGLIEAFLNPLAFAASGPTPDEAAGAIVRGTTRQLGNEIDEFVTVALRNNLLGLPLDLPAINLARGRDAGIPSLNAARREFYAGTGDEQLRPYASWADFAQFLKHPESLINFIAAYGLHSALTAADVETLAEKRAVAVALVFGGSVVLNAGTAAERTFVADEQDRLDFLNSAGAWASGPNGVTTTGLDNVDLWIGGLAERKMPFGGMLGSTFNFVFETQLESLQDGDRLYYLHRLSGLNFVNELENNSFAKLIMLNTDATHLPGLVFQTPGLILEVDQDRQFNAGLGNADPDGESGLLTPLVIRDNPATDGPDENYLQYTGDEHIVLGGTDGDDILIASIGDDTIYGDAGNDRIEGGDGNDMVEAGAGDDIITDKGGDDVLKGDDGNDVIHGGNGINLIIGGRGSDFIITGEDITEVIAGEGNDFILGSRFNVQMAGNEGDDWIEIGSQDGAPGDNFNPFGDDAIRGHDVFLGDGGFDEMIGEGGDDIFVGSAGPDKLKGMSGYDWATYKDMRSGVSIDFFSNAFNEAPVPVTVAATTSKFAGVEGLSGSRFGDVLSGDDNDAAGIATEGAQGSVLTDVTLIKGLQEFLGAGVTSFGAGNIILGGDGSDIIAGRGGDDLIDGDKWLDVYIVVHENADGTGAELKRVSSLTELVFDMVEGNINPGQLEIVREIKSGGTGFNYDTAVFSGNQAEYIFSFNDNGTATLNDDIITVTDTVVGRDGTDRLTGIERLQFANSTLEWTDKVNNGPQGTLTILNAADNTPDGTPTAGQLLRVSAAGVTDADNPGQITGPITYYWQVETVAGSGVFEDIGTLGGDGIATAVGPTFEVTPDLVGLNLRVKAHYQDARGVIETVFSGPTAAVAAGDPVGPPPAPVAEVLDTPTEGVRFIRSDLQFFLEQIKIAERHAAGEDLLSLLPNPRVTFGLRTVDGSYNNLLAGQSEFGAADNVFPRLTDPVFNPAEGAPAGFFGPGSPAVPGSSYQQTTGSVFDSQPRTISNLIVDQTMNNPAAIAAALRTAGSEDVPGDTAAVLAALQAIEDAETNAAAVLAAFQQAITDAEADVVLAEEAVTNAVTALNDAVAAESEAQEQLEAAQAASAAATAAFVAFISLPGDQSLDPQFAVLLAAVEAAGEAALAAEAARDEASALVVEANDSLSAAQEALATEQAEVVAAQAEYDAAVASGAGVQTANDAFEALAESLGLQVVASPGLDGTFGTADDAPVLFIPNVAPDEGLSAGFNAWMTFFGQFFDHGLDLVTKGGSGTIFIPLQPDDPLYVPGGNANFMVLTRATNLPGNDGILGTADDIHEHTNTTSPFVDQNQTYSSHPSHQVFLRAYEFNDAGEPVATGRLITNRDLGADGQFGTVDDVEIGGMATWKVVKAQARDILGINLTDANYNNVPLLATDAYGNFLKGPNGFPQIVFPGNVLVEGDPAANGGVGIDIAGAVRTGHGFLDDIARNAVPVIVGGVLQADADSIAGNAVPAGPQGNNLQYDNELLDAHYIAGDGRANENIGLTAVHHVFHSEHNRLVEHTKAVALGTNDLAFLSEWLVAGTAPAAFPVSQADIDALQWNGERLFQAAKVGTEMQYQHLVFEEFARTIQPQIDVFIGPTQGYDANIDPSIVAEFAHTVYRFGHSMLTETIDRLDPDYVNSEIGLIAAFLNPLAFAESGPTPDEAAGAIVRGTTRQLGNEIDEFVTEALRNNLLGLPLDLATINLARGRDTGIPSLNAARRDFYEMTGDSQLKPYTSWVDFVQHLKHPESLINFIAAYGKHSSITGVTTLAEKRAAATLLVFGGADEPADRLDFLNSTGSWASGPNGVTITGLDTVDLWIGGLAEKKMPFGGMLGSTFNFVFETQLENLQNSDRFYYLDRLAGHNFVTELENNSFAKLIMANTDATHLPGLIFQTPGLILEVDQARQFNAGLGTADPDGESGLLTPLVIRNNPATPGADTNYLQYTGDEHVVLGGTDGDDILIASIGDDTIWGDAGNDRIEGGDGNDMIEAGAGDDIITDKGGDDVIKGGDGNDVIQAGNGVNLVIAGAGSDFVITGEDSSEAFGGTGDDFILGANANEQDMGNEGDDWLEQGNLDGSPGDNFDPLGLDLVAGNDVYIGSGQPDIMNGEGGDDIMVGSSGPGDKYLGASGFDWATFKDDQFGVNIDLTVEAFTTTPIAASAAAILARFAEMEGLSGSAHSDILRGDDADAAVIATQGAQGSVLTNIGLIDGLQAFLGAGVTSFDGGNIILGGGGSDIIEGRGGNDLIDGDKWLNVRISVRQNADGTGPEIASFDSMVPMIPFMLNGTYNPGQLKIVREILDSTGPDFDTAVFSDVRANYTITIDNRGTATDFSDDVVTVVHNDPTAADGVGAGLGINGTDRLTHIERLQFADQAIVVVPGLNNAPVGRPTISDTTPTEDQLLSVTIAGVTDADNISPTNPTGAITGQVVYYWQVETRPGTGEFEDILALVGGEDAPVTGQTFRPGDDLVGLVLRVKAVYQDADGVLEEVFSLPTDPVANVNDAPTAAPLLSDLTPTEGLALTVDPFSIIDPDGTTVAQAAVPLGFTFQWEQSANNGTTWAPIAGATGQLFVPGQAQVGLIVRAVVSYVDDGNTLETIASLPSGIVGDLFFGTPGANTFTGTAGDDSAFGLGGNDTLRGNAGNDTLDGDIGNDTLDGGSGIDTMSGGIGNDTYTVDNINDVVTENPGEGTDTVQTSLVTYTLAENVENLTLISVANGGPAPGTVTTNFVWTGNALGNVITSNGGNDTLDGAGGNDTLNGGGGNDTLIGGTGNDTANGGAGNDRFVAIAGDGNDTYNGGADIDTYDASGTSAALTIAGGVATSTAVGTDTLAAIENYIGSQGNDSITVNAGINVIDGQAGNDTINAGGNNDTVLGGSGNDVLNGEAGNDTMDGGADDDTLRGGAGNDTLAGGIGNDIFEYVIGDGTDAVDGGIGSDTLNIVGTAAANTLDVIFNGTSITQFETGTVTGVEAVTADLLGGADRLSYAGSTSGVTVDLAAGTASGFTTIAGIENVTGGSGADTLRANGNAQVNNLAGGLGDDTYFADNGDTITEAANAGTDLVFTSSGAFTLAANVENLTFTGVGGFNGTGNGSNNVITGNGGTDVLNGAGGNDTLIGNGGIDSLAGGAGDDTLIGGAGNDVLNGDAGNDTLIGGADNDVMNGGAGNDIFTFAPGFGADVINGFDANPAGGQDLLNLSQLGISAGNFAASVLITDLGTDTLVTINVDGTGTVVGSMMLIGVNGVGANVVTQQDFILL